jgi:hypothetical protein
VGSKILSLALVLPPHIYQQLQQAQIRSSNKRRKVRIKATKGRTIMMIMMIMIRIHHRHHRHHHIVVVHACVSVTSPSRQLRAISLACARSLARTLLIVNRLSLSFPSLWWFVLLLLLLFLASQPCRSYTMRAISTTRPTARMDARTNVRSELLLLLLLVSLLLL